MGCSSSSSSTHGGIGSDEVLIDVKVSTALPGGEQNTWQVRLQRGATIADIKNHICELYEMPVEMQILRYSPDEEPLDDGEKLGRERRVTMHLSARNPLQDLVSALTGGTVPGGGQTQGTNPLDLFSVLTGGTVPGGGQAPSANPFAVLTEQMSSAMAEINAIQESLAEAEYSLKFVLAAKDSGEREKRCLMKVAATAVVNDVLDMVKLELNVENKRLALEFAGRTLPAAAQIHICGLGDDDTVMLVPAA